MLAKLKRRLPDAADDALLNDLLAEAGAHRLCQLLRQRYPGCEPTVGLCGGLCSYYAERGGLLVGYEI